MNEGQKEGCCEIQEKDSKREREEGKNSPWPFVQIYIIHQTLPGRRDEGEKKKTEGKNAELVICPVAD